jgi:hypothetical protein
VRERPMIMSMLITARPQQLRPRASEYRPTHQRRDRRHGPRRPSLDGRWMAARGADRRDLPGCGGHGSARRGRDGAGGIDAAEGQQHRPRARERAAVQNRVESEVRCSRRTGASNDACAALCSSARHCAAGPCRVDAPPSSRFLLNPFAHRHLRQHSRNWPIAPLTSDNSLSVSQRF